MVSKKTPELVIPEGEYESGIARLMKPDGSMVAFAIHPETKQWAEADIERGDYEDFDDVDEFFDTPRLVSVLNEVLPTSQSFK